MSTISPLASAELAERLAKRGTHVLDAPVSGGVKGATEGRYPYGRRGLL
jgi:3-hydroxyisobutyrate dehydrogenase-like beta-hydroxyacid dehydrogenase